MSDIKKFFDENGYYVARGLFAHSIPKLEHDFDWIVGQLLSSNAPIDATWDGAATAKLASAQDRIFHTHNVQKYSRTWLDAFLTSAFLDVAEAIFESPNIILHHSKLFQKPAENGSPFPMHQDWPYFPTEKNSMIAAIIHVSDATDQMGCLRVYPGSHKLGRLEDANGRGTGDTLTDYPIERAKIIECQAGDVIFFHYFTLHGSMPNRADKTRKTVLVQLYEGQDQVEAGNKHPDEHLVLRGWNHQMSRSLAGQRQQAL